MAFHSHIIRWRCRRHHRSRRRRRRRRRRRNISFFIGTYIACSFHCFSVRNERAMDTRWMYGYGMPHSGYTTRFTMQCNREMVEVCLWFALLLFFLLFPQPLYITIKIPWHNCNSHSVFGMNMAMVLEEAVVNGDGGRNHSNSMNWKRNEAPTKLARIHIYLCIITSYKYWKCVHFNVDRVSGGVLGLEAIKYETLTHTTGAFNG